jgi:diacylglycerol kinase (ATP)
VKTCIILNPEAGGGTPDSPLDRALAHLADSVVRPSPEPGAARALAAEAAAEGFERIVAAGGDGTLNEVLNGLAPDLDAEIGLIPLGTGNDLARTLSIPADPESAVEVLRRDRTRAIDAVRVSRPDEEDEWFLNASAGGFSGAIDERLDGEVKGSWGPLAYLRGALEALASLEPYRLRLELEGGEDDPERTERIATPAVNLVVANGRTIAAGIPVAPDAAIDDGLADVVLIRPAPVSRLSVLASKTLVGLHEGDELVIHRRARRVTVHAEPAMPFNLDGELSGTTPVRYEVVPRAVRFVVP